VGNVKSSINQLLDRLSIRYRVGEFGVRYTTMETVTMEGQSRTQEMELRAPQITAEGNFDSAWVRGVSDAHRVKAWCGKLLDGDSGLKVRLLDQIKLCVDAVHGGFIFSRSNADKAKKLANLLPTLIEMLEQTSHLMALNNDIDKLLAVHLTRPKDLLRLGNDQSRIAQNAVRGINVGASPILAAELDDPLDRLTNESWLCLLNRAAQQGRLDVFKREVLRGATGLSKEGLLTVLELEDQADASRVRSALQERMGLMRDIEGTLWEAQWWQSMNPEAPTMSYQYRILPKMDPALQIELAQLSTGGNIRYIYTGLGVIGLYVLAFHGVSLNASPGPDTLSAPAYLLAPMVPVVREFLDQWREQPQPYQPSGQFELVSAGVIGEPLYRNALVQIGLTEDEIGKIGQFYQLF
jgi:hypothetical protein